MSEQSGWVLLGAARVGRDGAPGAPLHDVTARISRRGQQWRVDLKEQWGSNQGYRQVTGEREVSASDTTLHEAIAEARADARDAQMKTEYVVQALGQAQREALDVQVIEIEIPGGRDLAVAGRLIVLVQAYDRMTGDQRAAIEGRLIVAEIEGAGRAAAYCGGFAAMKALHDDCEERVGNTNEIGAWLNRLWDGIGGWMA